MIRNSRDWEDDREYLAADDERDTDAYQEAFIRQYVCKWCGTRLEKSDEEFCGYYCQDMYRDSGQGGSYSKL